MRFARPAALAALAFGIVAGAAAQTPGPPQKLGSFDGWTTYLISEDEHPVCYALSGPSQVDGRVKRGKAYLMVTERPAEHSLDVVSIRLGYQLPANGTAKVTIDDRQSFDFFTKGQTAWTRDSATDRAVVAAMAAGLELAVKTRPQHGPETTDLYSLTGFTRALSNIDRVCKVPG